MITISTFLFVSAILLAVGIGALIVYSVSYSRSELQYKDVVAAVNDSIRAYEELFEYHDEGTLMIVLQSLRKHGVSVNTAKNMINTMQNEGIFFRQRTPEVFDYGQ